MNTFNKRIEERSYLLPQRINLTLKIVALIAEEGKASVAQLMKATSFSKAYVAACCQGLHRYGVLKRTRGKGGGYSLVKETTVGEVLSAMSKTEDRSEVTIALHRILIDAAKNVTFADLLKEMEKTHG